MNAITARSELAFDSAGLRSRADHPGSTVAPAPKRGISGLLRWIADYPRRRAVIGELQSMSDHELADIGLERAEVARVFDPSFTTRRRIG